MVISTLKSIEDDFPNRGSELVVEVQKKDDISYIHYISVVSGPLLTWAMASMYCYIPIKDMLKEPFYWYEHDLVTIAATLPTFLGITMLQGKSESHVQGF